MQVVAWTGMLVGYTAEHGLEAGVSKTFDGSAPCELCNAIMDATLLETDPVSPLPERLDGGRWLLAGPFSTIEDAAVSSDERIVVPTVRRLCGRHPQPPRARPKPRAQLKHSTCA